MMKGLLAILAGALLAACGGNMANTAMARYDFGTLADQGWKAPMPIAEVAVEAASWLSSPAMHFRLAYAEPLRRQTYAESRWAAPPADLLEAFLKRRIMFGQADFSGSGCRLQLALDELEQRFDDPQNSQMVLAVRALLTPSHGAEILSSRVFVIRKPATAPDARGGAAAARDAVQALAADTEGWLTAVGREKPAIVQRCGTA